MALIWGYTFVLWWLWATNAHSEFSKLREKRSEFVCVVCGKKRRASDIVYVDAVSGAAVCSVCASKIRDGLVEWERRGLEEAEEFLKKRQGDAD